MRTLLAVDVGLRTGLALYDETPRLLWYRSHNFGTAARLKRGVYGVMHDASWLAHVVVEGGGNLAMPWTREAGRRGVNVLTVQADEWRELLMVPRERRNGRSAKAGAVELAPQVIRWAQGRRPTSLRHDTAEAVMVGLWGLLTVGWLERLPDFLE